ncbi:hypothetical protein JF541_16750 [Marinobacter hydrocarbonoclasticus]|uniref:hypothetical protein n=1 Tax=Marinobacter nauticus TaxID=2743 RepID=UPI001A8DFD3F|nr:hypothetical protein [Marinobacter nauticus]MBN8240813.1 hypothetical protein [Marinobacter nauticus]
MFVFDSVCTHFIGTQQAITYQRKQEAQIIYQATHDLLTGSPNEVLFQETVHEALIVDGGRGVLAALSLDLVLQAYPER